MNIEFYITNLLLFLFYSILVNNSSLNKKKATLIIFVISAIQLLWIQSFYDNEKLLDSFRYISVFQNSKFSTVASIRQDAMANELGIGYILYNKLISYFTNDIHLFYMVTYFIIDIPLLWYFYKVSNNYILTFLLYICHPMLFWDSNYILRQHLAISLSAIVIYYSNKKLISIPMAIVAASMHLSAIVIIPFLIWKELKLGKASVVKIVFMVGLALIILSVLFYQLVAQSDRYSGYLTAEHNLYLVPFLLLAPLVVILYMQRRFIYKNVHERNLFEYLLYGLVITLFSMSSSFGRITTYFIAFVPVAVPIVLKYSYKKNLLIFMYVFFLFAIELYMLYLNCNGIFRGNLIQ